MERFCFRIFYEQEVSECCWKGFEMGIQVYLKGYSGNGERLEFLAFGEFEGKKDGYG